MAITLLKDAAAVRPLFQKLVSKLAGLNKVPPTTVLQFDPTRLKSVVRIVEKAALRPDTIGACDCVCDIVRAMLVVHSLWQAACTAKMLLSEQERGNICIVRLKDRWTRPTPDGWRDLMVNFYFVSDEHCHICEVQIVHSVLLMARKDLPGHTVYVQVRNARELLEFYHMSE